MGAKFTGKSELTSKLKRLTTQSIGLNRRAVNAASTPMLRAEKSSCPIDHGHLKKALAKKVYNRGPIAIAVIGADAAYVVRETTGEKLQLGSSKAESKAIIDAAREDGGVIRPAKYDHLVEFGHVTKEGAHIPANPFMRNGFDASVAVTEKTYEQYMANGLEKIATS